MDGGTIRRVALLAQAAARCSGRPLLAALDGRCGAGKTTLAAAAEESLGWAVVHMDDFFLRPQQRTPERLAQPGGNVDWERVRAEVLAPLLAGREARFCPYDCHAGAMGAVKTVPAAPVVLIEGSYACHPGLWDHYGLRAFLTVDADEQRRRILRRGGAEGWPAFRDRWIPLEEKYFAAFDIERRCDLVL